MIFNINSTRGHTGSLLVNYYRYVITSMVCGVSVTSANVAPSTVTHGRNRISRTPFGDDLPFSVGETGASSPLFSSTASSLSIKIAT